jgi:putative MATE family efflux protein
LGENPLDKKYLLQGNITKALITLAVPIMGTSFLQMANQIVDMIWIGRLGSDAVAAIGTAGFFVWMSMSLIQWVQVGSEVLIAQSVGAGDEQQAKHYAGASLYLAVAFGIGFTILLLLLNRQLIGFFELGAVKVEEDARNYLAIMAIGVVFTFLNYVIASMFNGTGRSKSPFIVNSIGIAINIVLDPILIFILGWGVSGAAIATVFSQIVVTVIMFILLGRGVLFQSFSLFQKVSFSAMKAILRLGAPVAFQRSLFTLFSILIAKVIASYGPNAIAAQKVGVQIEAISFMTARGFSVALSSFVGQNYGAGQMSRVREGTYRAGMIMTLFGIGTSLTLYLAAEPLIRIFVRETATVAIGIQYLRIIAFSQVFMCIEMTLAGCFNALNKSIYPAVLGIVFTGLRIPFAYLLSDEGRLGMDGIWWAISGSSIIKGLLMLMMIPILFRYGIRKQNSEVGA